MIPGIEPFYQRIAEGLQKGIPEEWATAKLEAIFYPDRASYFGEYTRKADGAARSTVGVSPDLWRALRELRGKFKEAGKKLWGRCCFEMDSTGKFNMKFGYEDCDANGDAVYDEDAVLQENSERRERLSRSPAEPPPLP